MMGFVGFVQSNGNERQAVHCQNRRRHRHPSRLSDGHARKHAEQIDTENDEQRAAKRDGESARDSVGAAGKYVSVHD